MPKIPTFTAKGSIEQLAGTTTNIQMGLNNNLANALAPITKAVVNHAVKENALQNQAEALRLQNDYITDQIKITETINSDEIMSVNKDIANKYFKDQNNTLINKYKSQATNGNVGIKFENYALAETRKTIFRNDKKISENILKNLFRGYDDQKQLLLITADTDDSGIAKGTLRTDLEKLTIDTFQSQVTYPELQIMLDNIPVELQTYNGLKDVQQAPRKTFYALKDKNYLPDISFEQRQKLEEKAMTLIRPQISTEWKNYIDTVAAGKEPPRFDMELAKEIMPEPIVRQMIAEDTFTKDRVTNNAVLLNAPIGTTQEVAQAFIDEGYEMYTEAQANQNEQYIRGIVANKQKAIKNDPVKFLSSIDNDIQSLYNDLQNQEDTAAIQTKKELIDLLIAKQREMNFDETDIRVASNFEIQGMIESVTNPETTALQKIQFIDQVQLMYGKENIGKIFNQLENQKLPREYMVAFSTNSVELKKDILSASSQNLQDLEDLVRKRMPSGKKFIDIGNGVAKGMEDFENVLSAQGESSEDITKYVKSIQDTIYKSALFRMQNKKIPMDEAISSAVNEFTKDYYIPSSQTYFIPADVNGDETNRMIIEDKAEAILLEVEKGDYLDRFHGKDGYMHYAKLAGIENLTEEKVKDRIKSTIENNSKWLLNSDSTGIILNAEYANGTYPIVNANGQKIEFFFVDTDNNKGILSTELKFPVTGDDIELIDYADPYGAYEYEETVIDENQNIDSNLVVGETVDTIGGDKPLKDPFALENPIKNNDKKMINFGLGTFEKSPEEIGSLYNQTKTGFWDTAGATFMNAWNYNPTSSVFRAVEQTQAYRSSSEYLDRDELNKEYGSLGLSFKKDTRAGLVDYIVERKKLENERSNAIARGPTGKLAKSFFFLESLATSFLDPINLGASFVPVVGQARFANMVAQSGKNIARLKKGFVEGLVGNAAVEPLVYGVAKSEQADYDAFDSFANIAVGGFIGSAAHVGFGRIGDFIAEKRGKPNIYQKLAAISPENQQALLRYSVGKVLKGEKVDTGNIIVEKTVIGDEQLNKLDNQIKEYKTLYKNSVDNGDRKSAKIYLQNLRNLQKTERDLFESKRKANDEAKLQEQKEGINANNKKTTTEIETTRQEKETSEIEIDGENLNQTVKFRQKQLDIKDEDISVLSNTKAEIEKIDNNIKNKKTIRQGIEAGTNCTKRNS